MQSLKQDRTSHLEVRDEVWCIKCKGQGHAKEHYPVFANYLVGGGPMRLGLEAQVGDSMTRALWCAICQIAGKHATQTSKHFFCYFCRLLGHHEHNCRSYGFMMDRTPTYMV